MKSKLAVCLFLLFLSTLIVSTTPAAVVSSKWYPLGGGRSSAPSVRYREEKRKSVAIDALFPGFSATEIEAEGELFQILAVRDCGSQGKVGRPDLPFKGFFLEIPYGVGLSLETEKTETVSLGKGFRVYPRQPPQPDSDAAPPFVIDEAFYQRDDFFPPRPIEVGKPAFIRGRRVVFVEVSPLQYNPATGEVRGFGEIAFRLVFTGEADPGEGARKSRLFSPSFEKISRRLILNWEPITGLFPARGIPTGNAGDYLIITADDFHEEVLPLSDWKRAKGYLTEVVKLSEIGAGADDVQSYLQDVYDNWSPAPTFVLLVGDQDKLPCPLIDSPYFGVFPSDLPYSCLDGGDYLPDVTLGRLSVESEAECTTVVNKILKYDREPDTGSWYEDALLAAYFQDSNDHNGYADRWFMETIIHVMNFLDSEVGLNISTAFCTTDFPLVYEEYHYRVSSYPHRPFRPDPVPESVVSLWTATTTATTNIAAGFNAGVGQVLHRDHGGETGWADPPFYVANVEALANGDRTPVVFSINCLTGAIDYGGGDCFAEALQKKSSGGAVGVVAATRVSYSGYNDLLAHGIYTCFWPDYDSSHTDPTYAHSSRPAEAMNYGKYYMFIYEGDNILTEYQFQIFHWFGDPEISMRVETPASLDVSHPATVTAGVAADFTVTVEVGGSPLSGALVCLSIPERPDEYLTGTTNGSGEVTFSGFTPRNAGVYDLVVTADDTDPYEGTVTAGAGAEGVISLDADFYTCSDTITITLSDSDLAGFGSQTVNIYSNSETDPGEYLLLSEGAQAGVFSGSILTASSPAAGELEVNHGDTITAHYYDADTGGGSPGNEYAIASADCRGPSITSVILGDGNGVITVALSENAASAGLSASDVNPSATGDKLGSDPIITPARCNRSIVFSIAATATDARQFSASDVFNFGGAEEKIVDIHGAPIVTTPGSPTVTLSDVTPPDFTGAYQAGDHEIAVGFTEPVDTSTVDFTDFTVSGYTPCHLEADSTTEVTLSVEESLGEGGTPQLGMSGAGAIDDLSGNELNAGNDTPLAVSWADYYVSANLGSDYSGDGSRGNPWASIDKALDEAEGAPDNPVRIAVAEGAYSGTVYMEEWEDICGGFDEITWVRDIDANLSIIDAEQGSYGVRGANHAEISGFTVQSAKYGIYCSSGAPTIRSNRIESCTYGIRWSYQGGSGLIEKNTVNGSRDDGIGLTGGAVTVSRNIVSNSGDSGIYCSGAQVVLSNNLIAASMDDGIYVTGGASVTLSNNTILGSGDYGIYLSTYSGGSAIVKNCIVWDNVDDDLSSSASATYSCLEDGDAGEGNISSYPAFVDQAGGDYRLQSSSPCIDQGTNGASWYGDEDLDGNDRVAYGNSGLVVDMGPYEYNPLAGIAWFSTVDHDGNHRIDHIEVVLDSDLNDDFGGLSMAVEGYTLDPSTPYVTSLSGGGAGDDTFYVALQEGGSPDTGARPLTAITGNTTLRKDGDLVPEGSGLPADGVSPALLSSTLGDGDGLFTLLFSEEVTATGVTAGDIDPAATAAKLGTSPLIDQADDSAAMTFQVSPSAVDAVQFGAIDVFNLAGAELKVRDGNDNALSTDSELPLVALTDVTSPDFDSAFKLDPTTIAVNFDEPFDSGTLEASDFSVQTNTVLSRTITASNRVELGLQDPIGGGEYPLVSIAPAGSIDDLSGNELNSANDTPVMALDPPSDSYYYVSIEYGSDATGDGAPFNPFRTISHALDSISGSAGNPLQVAVAEGTYAENVEMDAYESLYGGYNGQDWLRNWTLYTTIIDGGLSGDTVTNAANAALDGFVITNAGDDGLSCYSSNFIANNNLITGNADEGVYCSGVTGLEITSNLIAGNTDNGIYCTGSSPLISENQISGNTDYGIYCGSGSSPTISNNTITGNDDGIYCSSASLTPTITGNIIEGNQDDGINNANASPGPIANNLILGNQGDGIYLSRPNSVLVKNNTIVNNGDDGVDTYSAVSPPEIRNCIIRDNGSNDLEDCQATFSCIGDGDAGRGNISSDPLFVGGGDYHLQSTEGSYHGGLWTADASDSPCLNNGFYVDDYSLEPAPNGGRINMGAYGNTGEASKSTVYHPTPPTTPAPSPTRTPTPPPTSSPTPPPTSSPTPPPTATPVPPGQDVPFTEDFEGSWSDGAPSLWTKEYISGTTNWIKASGGQDGNPPSAHGGSYNALFFRANYDRPVTRLISPRLRFREMTSNTRLVFWHAMQEYTPPSLDQDELSVYYRSAESDPWTLLAEYDSSVSAWTRRELSLPDPSDDYYICFEGTANYGYGVCIDDVLITGESAGSTFVLDSGDYNGDGTSDIAIFRGSNGMWSVRGVTRVYYGSSSDIPIPGDYNGDGTADTAIFRGSSGLWGVRNVTRVYYGSAGDIPIPGDYNGDGSADIGIFRSSSGLWAVVGVTRAYFGRSGDRPIPGVYGGGGALNIGIFRPSSGLWAIQGLPRVYFGSASDKVVPGDYNGDGTWEVAIFRPASGMWAAQGVTRAYYGSASDHPVPADYDGDSRDDFAIFRSTSGLWGVKGVTRAYFGSSGDIPVTR